MLRLTDIPHTLSQAIAVSGLKQVSKLVEAQTKQTSYKKTCTYIFCACTFTGIVLSYSQFCAICFVSYFSQRSHCNAKVVRKIHIAQKRFWQQECADCTLV